MCLFVARLSQVRQQDKYRCINYEVYFLKFKGPTEKEGKLRYIALSEVEERTLEEVVKNQGHARQRRRAQGLLLSHRGFKIDEIARIGGVDRDTVVRWFNRWAQWGMIGLQDRVRSGRAEKLTPQEQGRVQQLFKRHARAPKRIAGEMFKETGKQVSVDTIRRLGKKNTAAVETHSTVLKEQKRPAHL